MTTNDFNLKLVESITDNYKNITGISSDFDIITIKLDLFITKITIYKNNNTNKKYFSRLINYNHKLIIENFDFDQDILKTFEDSTHENWNLLHIICVSYLSYLKNTVSNIDINYKGMINKLMSKIEERTNELSDESPDDSDLEIDPICDSNSNSNNLLNLLKSNIPTSDQAPPLMKGLLSDIKDMINNTNASNPKNLLNMSRDISTKYQGLIDNGNVNINDLIGGVLGLLTNPDTINEEFKDIDTSNLPDPNLLLGEIKDDLDLKNTINSMSSNNMNIFGSLMANMMDGNKSEDNKTIQELEKDIERMMTEVQELDNNETK